MGWLRGVLTTLAGLALGAALGSLCGWFAGARGAGLWWAVLGGGAAGVALASLREAVRARRLLEWLRGPAQSAGPRDPGYWGEVAYRIERALRRGEREVEEERSRLRQFLTAIEASPNGVMLLDASDRIEWCNGVAADHFGLDPQRDRLQRVTNLVRQPAFVACMQSGSFDEAVTLSSSLERRTITVLVRPYGDGLKLVLSQDTTERERSEAMRRDFVANVSHEIRTPLTVLAGFVETMSTLPLGDEERARVLQLMGAQTSRIQALVDDLLTLAQLEGSPRPPPDRWHSLTGIVRRVEADATALSGGRHRLQFHCERDLEVAGSDLELLSAVGNLVGNAVRYTPEGGRIEVSARSAGDGGLEIEVDDDGIGIAREHLPRLTERFYRVDSSRSRETGGTGLGLSIVKHVVQRHGGEIEIESEPGKGSRFRLVLPAARLRRVASVPATRGTAAMPSSGR